MDAVVVRAAMGERVIHRRDDGAEVAFLPELNDAVNAAHGPVR